MPQSLKLLRIDTRQANVRQAIADLRERLSPRGNIVSEAGRRKTIEVFGEPLTPQQVVERICNDVRTKGLPAVLDYSKRIDQAELTPQSIRVSAAELAAAHKAADPRYLATIRRIRDNILRFQRAILERDVKVELPDGGGYLRQRYLAALASRYLRARRRGGLSFDGIDDGRPRTGGWCETVGNCRAAD